MNKQEDKNEFLNKLLDLIKAYKEKLSAQEVFRIFIDIGVTGAVHAAPKADKGISYASLCFSESLIDSVDTRTEEKDKE